MNGRASINSRRRSRHTLLVVLALALSAVFTYLAVRDVRWPDVWEALSTMDYVWLVPSLALLALATALRAFRWQLMFEPRTRPPYGPTLKALLAGQFFNSVLPVRAGEPARIVLLNRWAGTSLAETTGTVVLERVLDVLSLLVIFLCLTPWLPDVRWVRASAVFAIGLTLGVAAAAIILVLFGERPLHWLLRPLKLLPFLSTDRVDRAAQNLARGLAVLRRPRLATAASATTIVSWILLAASNWVLMLGFDLDPSPLAGMLVAIATGLSFIIPSAPSSVGVFEAAAVLALDAYGISNSAAFSYALVVHAVNLVPYLIAGAVIFRVDRLFGHR